MSDPDTLRGQFERAERFAARAVELATERDIALRMHEVQYVRAQRLEAAIEGARMVLDGWEHDGPDDPALRLLIQRVREAIQ